MADKTSTAKVQKKSQAQSTLASDNRRLRNRLSQKAHRARQSIYIKELEKRLECASKPETLLNAELEKRNAFFRGRLLDCQKKLESMQATMKSLSDSVASALDMELSEELHGISQESNGDSSLLNTPSSRDFDSSPETGMGLHESSYTMDIEDSNFVMDDFMPLRSDEVPEKQSLNHPTASELCVLGQDDIFSDYLVHNDVSMFAQHQQSHQLCNPKTLLSLPQSLSSPSMGPMAYLDNKQRGTLLMKSDDCHLRRTNSTFSDHISVFEYFLQNKWESARGLSDCQDAGLAASVSFMVSMFVTMSWSKMTAFYAHTKSHHSVVKLITWRLNPTVKEYESLGSSYMPSRIQISTPHPTIIDWVPWPALRDKLILCHSASPQIDDIICDIGNSFVAEADLSELVSGFKPVIGYVGVWDLIAAISPDTTVRSDGVSTGSSSTGWGDTFEAYESEVDEIPRYDFPGLSSTFNLPAPSVAALFNSKSYALQAFRKMNMDKGSLFFKLDPLFFERHPELYDCKTNLMAQGMPLRPQDRSFLPGCIPLDKVTLGKYRECATWTFDLSHDGLIPTEQIAANSFA